MLFVCCYFRIIYIALYIVFYMYSLFFIFFIFDVEMILY